jgi:cbb3-type cytochrome oxidase subunit 3
MSQPAKIEGPRDELAEALTPKNDPLGWAAAVTLVAAALGLLFLGTLFWTYRTRIQPRFDQLKLEQEQTQEQERKEASPQEPGSRE